MNDQEIASEYLKFVDQMSKLEGGEEDHMIADSILCQFLEILGYEEIVRMFRMIDRWYS